MFNGLKFIRIAQISILPSFSPFRRRGCLLRTIRSVYRVSITNLPCSSSMWLDIFLTPVSPISYQFNTTENLSFPEMEHKDNPALKTENQTETELTISSGNDVRLRLPGMTGSSVCAFSMIEADMSETEERSRSVTKLYGLIAFYLVIMVIEIIGGIKANSLAVLTDAAHMFIDVASFSASLLAIWAAGWKATYTHSFGFHRFEVLGALMSVLLIWLICVFLMYEAVDRFLHGSVAVNGKVMFVVSALGFITNLVMVFWLGHGHSHHAGGTHHHHHHDHVHHHPCSENDHDHEAEIELGHAEVESANLISPPIKDQKTMNINIQGAYLHVMADLIQSIGVMFAGAIIWAKPELLVTDLLCTGVSSIFILSSTLSMLTGVLGILMERTPNEIDIVGLEKGLKCIKGVLEIHDLHVWSITAGKICLTCHAMVDPGAQPREVLHDMKEYCKRAYRINHTTIQIEQ